MKSRLDSGAGGEDFVTDLTTGSINLMLDPGLILVLLEKIW